MYQGTDFVGRMDLPLVAIGEQFTAGFGVDPQLQVQRQMIDKSRTMQGGNQVLKYEYRILVSSYKAEPAKLQVWDRLPHAENEVVAVNLVKATPETSTESVYVREHKPHNLLRWDVKVDPAMSGDKALAINYEFKLELDKQMTLGSFTTGEYRTELSRMMMEMMKEAPSAPNAAPPVPAAPPNAPRAVLSHLNQS